MTGRTLVAGVGNVFLGDDAFGCEVVRLLAEQPVPDSLTGPVMDAHDLTPDTIFALLASLGGRPGRSLVVACEPADVGPGMGLSEPVRQALPHAVRTVQEILSPGRRCYGC
jgi:Ni,Fe-hydrogenase maturation factor